MGCSNFQSFEGNISTETTKEFNLRARKIVLINDSSSTNLQFKLNSSEGYGTLKPTEELSMEGVHHKSIILNASSPVPYRLWVFA